MSDLDFKTYPRAWDRTKLPVVIDVEMLTERLTEFEKRARDQRNIAVLGHDLSNFGQIVVYVACTDADVGRWLQHHWSP